VECDEVLNTCVVMPDFGSSKCERLLGDEPGSLFKQVSPQHNVSKLIVYPFVINYYYYDSYGMQKLPSISAGGAKRLQGRSGGVSIEENIEIHCSSDRCSTHATFHLRLNQ
jgi:hypothetical protein